MLGDRAHVRLHRAAPRRGSGSRLRGERAAQRLREPRGRSGGEPLDRDRLPRRRLRVAGQALARRRGGELRASRKPASASSPATARCGRRSIRWSICWRPRSPAGWRSASAACAPGACRCASWSLLPIAAIAPAVAIAAGVGALINLVLRGQPLLGAGWRGPFQAGSAWLIVLPTAPAGARASATTASSTALGRETVAILAGLGGLGGRGLPAERSAARVRHLPGADPDRRAARTAGSRGGLPPDSQ